MSGYTTWRIVLLAILAGVWIALSFGINEAMIAQNMGAIWQLAAVLFGWWVLYLGIARFLYED